MGLAGKTIGIVGGVGPHAGIDLFKKIVAQTKASGDAGHLDVVLVSEPSSIPNRTDYLLGISAASPAPAIVSILGKLEAAGAELAGIPCNTSHSPRIMAEIRDGMAKAGLKIRLLDMVEELVGFAISLKGLAIRRPGVLATTGTIRTEVYQSAFGKAGIEAIAPCPETQEKIQQAIYDPAYGIKAVSMPPSARARESLLAAAAELKAAGADSIVLGCTELPLALPESQTQGLPSLDSTLILARALIREAAPERLKPLAS